MLLGGAFTTAVKVAGLYGSRPSRAWLCLRMNCPSLRDYFRCSMPAEALSDPAIWDRRTTDRVSLSTMVSSVTPLRREPPLPQDQASRAVALAEELASGDGHTPVLFPDMCVYRFTRESSFRKAATFGVTLGVVLQGTKRVRMGEDEFHLDPSRVLVITRDSEHQNAAKGPDNGTPYLGMSLCFGPERVARALLALSEAGQSTPQEEHVPAFVLPVDELLVDAIERLLRAMGDPLDKKLIAPLIIDEILFRLLRSDAAVAVRSAVGRPADAQRVLDSMQYIRERHAEKLTIDELAKHVAMSPSHFAHRFSAVARISPMRFLREVRLDRAYTLLLHSGARVSEVAMQVGFESPAHFTREFKRRYGMAPSKAVALQQAG